MGATSKPIAWICCPALIGMALLSTQTYASGCFYDGVSQTTLSHLIEQINQRYQMSALTDLPPDQSTWVRQPLGDCPPDEFLYLSLNGSLLGYRLLPAGVLISDSINLPRPAYLDEALAPEESRESRNFPPDEILVTALRQPSTELEYRYQSVQQLELLMSKGAEQFNGVNLAERASLLPGVTITREGGEGKQIHVRGLNSSLVAVEINGMPSLATTSSIDSRGALNNSRSFDFNILPEALFTGIQVYKSSSADFYDGGVGGKVNMLTPLPSQYMDNQGWLNVSSSYNQLSEHQGNSLAFGGVKHWFDSRFSALLNLVRGVHYPFEKGYSTVRWRASNWGDLSQPGRLGEAVTEADQEALTCGELYHPRYHRYDVYDRKVSTQGGHLAIEWQPLPALEISLSALAADSRETIHEYHLSALGLTGHYLSHIRVDGLTRSGNDIVAGQFGNVDVRTEYTLEKNHRQFNQWLLRGGYQWTDTRRLQWGLSEQEANYSRPLKDKVYLVSEGHDFGFVLRDSQRFGLNQYGFDLQDESLWRLYRLNQDRNSIRNRYRHLELSLTDSLNQHWDIQSGWQWQEFNNQETGQSREDSSQRGVSVDGLTTQMPFDFAHGMPVGRLLSSWTIGKQAVINQVGFSVPWSSDPITGLEEYSSAGWVKLNYNGEFDWPVKAEFGLRLSQSRYVSTGFGRQDGDGDSIRRWGRYQNWLPSINLSVPSGDWLYRMSVSKTLAKPDIVTLTSGYSIDSNSGYVSSGNPDLIPPVAESLDLAVEWYPLQSAFVGLGVYSKFIDKMIIDQVDLVSVSGLPSYVQSVLLQSDYQLDDQVTYARAVNGNNARIVGAELSTVVPLYSITPALSDWTLGLHYNRVESETRYRVGSLRVKHLLTGLSRHSASVRFGYQGLNWRFSTAWQYRSRYLQAVPSNNGNSEEGVRDSLYASLRLGYQFDDGPLLDLNIDNVTDQPYDQYTDRSQRVYAYLFSGTRFTSRLYWAF